MKIFEKTYSDINISNVFEDIEKAFNCDYNDKIEKVEKICPKDEYGFLKAKWKITITFDGINQ